MSAAPSPAVAPLDFGHGPVELEAFLEPPCPYSKRAFGKFEALLAAVGEENLTIRVRLHSQPWHLFSGIVTRAVLAASATPDGRNRALRTMAGIYDRREDFEFDGHHSGANMNRTPTDILNDISAIAGIDLSEAWKYDSVGKALRWHTRYARQMGIHVSPTFAINRIVEPSMGSGESVEEWAARLGLPVKAAPVA